MLAIIDVRISELPSVAKVETLRFVAGRGLSLARLSGESIIRCWKEMKAKVVCTRSGALVVGR